MIAGLPHWLISQWEDWYHHHNLLGHTADPEFRADARSAKGFAAHAARGFGSKEPIKINDFLPFPPPAPKQTDEQLQANLVGAADRSAKRKPKEQPNEGLKPNGDAPAETTNQARSRPRRSHKRSKPRIQRSE